MEKDLVSFKNQISNLINKINNNFESLEQTNQKLLNKDYVSKKELKEYFKQSIDNQILTMDKKNHILKLKLKILNKNPEFSEKIKAKEVKNIEFEYLGFNIIDNDNTKEKIAFIAKPNSEKIYNVSIGTEIQNKYKIINLDSTYLYLKNILTDETLKLKMLNY